MMGAMAALFALLLMAASVDLHIRRIPNALIFMGLCISAGFALVQNAQGLFPWAVGALCGLALGLPLYAVEALGAGDVKLLALVGSFVGFPLILRALLYTLLVGGLWSLSVALQRRQLKMTLVHLWQLVKAGLQLRPQRRDRPRVASVTLIERAAQETLPYAIAIALGSGLAVWEQWP